MIEIEINQYIKIKRFLVKFFLRFLKFIDISFKNAQRFYESIQDIFELIFWCPFCIFKGTVIFFKTTYFI